MLVCRACALREFLTGSNCAALAAARLIIPIAQDGKNFPISVKGQTVLLAPGNRSP
jgi:hypothetical protein